MSTRQRPSIDPLPPSLQAPSLSPSRKEPRITGPKQCQDRSLHRLKGHVKSTLCSPRTWEFRTFSGMCNNVAHIDWGASNTGQVLHWRSRSSRPTGSDRPSARTVSNTCSRQLMPHMPNRRRMSEFVTFFGQFLDHNLVATPADPRNLAMNIRVSPRDIGFRRLHNNSLTMPFSRSARATSPAGSTALNAISSFLDLSAVYGDNDGRARALRSYRNGKLLVSKGDMLPWNTKGLANAPTTGREFYVAGDFRANEHVNLAVLHIVWMREHNKLCDSLKRDFPGWGDERLYQMARKINGASFQSVVYNEFYPALTGRQMPEYRGYSKKVNPAISLLFSTAAYRIGHTMVGNEVARLSSGNKRLPSLKLGDVFFTAPTVLNKKPLEEFVRGMVSTRAQEVDLKVTDLLRNFLFSAVPHENVFDLVATNIQRGRDHGLPPYNQVRRILGRKPARSYCDLTRNKQTAAELEKAYGRGNVNKIDAWVGLLAEPHIRGGSLGYSMFLIIKRELVRARAGDRFFYARPCVFSRQVRATISKHGKRTMRDILLRNTRLSPHEVPSVWLTSRRKCKTKRSMRHRGRRDPTP